MEIMTSIFRNIIIPLAYYLRGDNRFWYFKKYKNHLNWSGEQVRAYQLERLQALVRHAYETTDYYRELFDSIGIRPEDIRSLEDYQKIPPLDKKTVIKEFERLKSKKHYKGFEDTSGGSTGSRVVVFKDNRYFRISRAVWMRDIESAGFRIGAKTAWFWGAHMDNAPIQKKLLNRLLWSINRRITFNTLSYSREELEHFLPEIYNRFKPDYLIGYSQSIHYIAKFIKANNLKVHKPKMIMCTAERLDDRQLIEEVFECKVIDHYGCREIYSIAIEDQNYVMHSSDDFLLAEIGSRSEIMLTPLESYGMPLLRYLNGDLGIKKGDVKKDNHPFSQFSLKLGRTSEVLRSIDNKILFAPIMGTMASEARLNIGEFQMVQLRLDKLTLKIVKSKEHVPGDVEKFKEIIRSVMGNVQIDVEYLDKFPLEKSGKRLSYKCLINDNEK